MKDVLFVFAGGGTGSVVRYFIGWITKKGIPQLQFPLHTLVANLLACAVFAAVMVWSRHKISPAMQSLVLVGFCGGLSTFSSFSYETYTLFHSNFMLALINIVISVCACMGVFYLVR